MWMDRESIMLSEISQRKTNTVYHLYVKSKKITQRNIYAKQRQTHIHKKNKLVVTKAEGEGQTQGVRLTDTDSYT